MTGAKFTKGPWVNKRNGVIAGGEPLQLPNGLVQQQIAMACLIEDGDRDANTALITEAPELARALEWALRRIRVSLDCGQRYDEAAAILERATSGAAEL